MATIIKSILELTYLPAILIVILFTFILLNLYLLKTVLRWWRKRPKTYAIAITSQAEQWNSMSNKVEKQNERCIGKQIIKAYCFLQPCFSNMSTNKWAIVVLLSIWVYVVFCTQFTYAMSDYRSGVKEFVDRIVGLGAWFGWNLVLGAIIDFIIRIFLVKNVVDRNKTKNEQQKMGKKEVTSKNQSNIQNQSQKGSLDCWIISYYSILAILTICLALLSINSILQSSKNSSIASNSRTSLYSLNTQSTHQRIIVSLIDLFAMYLLNQIVFTFISALLYPILSSFKFSPNFQLYWKIAYGCSVEDGVCIGSLNRKRQVVPQFEQSKENIGEITQLNNIENLIFTQTIQAPTKQKYIFNSSTKTNSNPKQISTFTFGSTQNTNEKQERRKEIKTNAFETVEQNEHLNSLNIKMKMRKRKQILLTQSQLNVVEVKAKINQNQNRKKQILASKCRSLDIGSIGLDGCQEVMSITQHRYQKQQKGQTKRPKSFFSQHQILKPQILKPSQAQTPTPKQMNKQIKPINDSMIICRTKGQKKTDDQIEFNQEILGNIENRISVAGSFKKKKNIKQGLNVVNCAENQIQIQHVDLSKYSIYNLGHAQSKTIDYKPVLDFKKKNSLPPLNLATPTSKQQRVGQYNWSSKKKSMKSPCVPDTGVEAFTFCLHDIHVNSKPQ